MQAGVEEVAACDDPRAADAVPAAVPGIVFLSGGQTEAEATAPPVRDERARRRSPGSSASRTAARSRRRRSTRGGATPERVEAAQRAFYHRAKLNGAARTGSYTPEMELAAA